MELIDVLKEVEKTRKEKMKKYFELLDQSNIASKNNDMETSSKLQEQCNDILKEITEMTKESSKKLSTIYSENKPKKRKKND